MVLSAHSYGTYTAGWIARNGVASSSGNDEEEEEEEEDSLIDKIAHLMFIDPIYLFLYPTLQLHATLSIENHGLLLLLDRFGGTFFRRFILAIMVFHKSRCGCGSYTLSVFLLFSEGQLEVLYDPKLDHAKIFDDRRDMIPLLELFVDTH